MLVTVALQTLLMMLRLMLTLMVMVEVTYDDDHQRHQPRIMCQCQQSCGVRVADCRDLLRMLILGGDDATELEALPLGLVNVLDDYDYGQHDSVTQVAIQPVFDSMVLTMGYYYYYQEYHYCYHLRYSLVQVR